MTSKLSYYFYATYTHRVNFLFFGFQKRLRLKLFKKIINENHF